VEQHLLSLTSGARRLLLPLRAFRARRSFGDVARRASLAWRWLISGLAGVPAGMTAGMTPGSLADHNLVSDTAGPRGSLEGAETLRSRRSRRQCTTDARIPPCECRANRPLRSKLWWARAQLLGGQLALRQADDGDVESAR
jgi:hypothetical protein